MVTLVDKVGCAGESRHSWANSDANPGGDGRQQGRKYLVPVRYEARMRWFQCVFCTKEFRKPYDLVRHLRIHTKDKPFKVGWDHLASDLCYCCDFFCIALWLTTLVTHLHCFNLR